MKKIIILTLVLFYAGAFDSLAQFEMPYINKTEELQKRKLLVILKTTTESKWEENYNRGCKLPPASSEAVDIYNSNVRKYFTKYWEFSKDIQFQTEDQARQLISANPHDYAIFWGARYNYISETYDSEKVKWNKTHHEGFDIMVSLIIGQDSMYPIFNTEWDGLDKLSEIDFKFLIFNMNKLFIATLKGLKSNDMFSVEDNLQKLSNKTLLVPKPIIEDKGEDLFLKLYPHPYQIADYDFIINTILTDNKDFYYMTVMDGFISIIDIETQQILSKMTAGAKYLKHPTGTMRFASLGKMDIKGLTMKFGQKINFSRSNLMGIKGEYSGRNIYTPSKGFNVMIICK